MKPRAFLAGACAADRQAIAAPRQARTLNAVAPPPVPRDPMAPAPERGQ